ncbi:MAG: hypothetical protein LBF84_02885 [Holosporales bacterium]|nr:hypothetical protein [Holosporales bacterium]
MRKVGANKVILALAMLCGASCNAVTGYYFGVKGGGARKKVELNFQKEPKRSLAKEYKSTKLSGQVVSGYTYGLPNVFGLGGQVYVGYEPRDVDIKETWSYQASTGKYTMTSDLSFRNRFSFGFDALAGVNISHSFVFVTCGFCVQKPVLRGTIIGDLGGTKIGTYFGKEGLTVDTMKFPEVKAAANFITSLTVGCGIRCFFIERFFLGVECKYFLAKEKDLKMRYAAYDPTGVMELATGNSVAEMKDKKDRMVVPVTLKNIEIGFIIGLRL